MPREDGSADRGQVSGAGGTAGADAGPGAGGTGGADAGCLRPSVYEEPGCDRKPTCFRNLEDYGHVAVCTCAGGTKVYETYKVAEPFLHRGPCVPGCPAGQRPGYPTPTCRLGAEAVCVPDLDQPVGPYCGCDRAIFQGPPAPNRLYAAAASCPDHVFRWGPTVHNGARFRVGVKQRWEIGLHNDSARSVSGVSVNLAATRSDGFSLDASGCVGHVLAPGAICTLVVELTPSRAGQHSAFIDAFADGAAPLSYPLGALIIGPEEVLIRPATLDFGPVAVGSWSPLAAWMTNQSDGPARWRLAGEAAAEFRVGAGDCLPELAPGASCLLQLQFRPTRTGESRAILELTTASMRVAADLIGIGVAP